LNTFNDRKSCDFDGDGIADPFIATGVTFWYSSSVLGGRWVFLAQSPARVDEVSFGDFDGDGRCDVSARGQVFLNPDPLPFARNPGNVSAVLGTPAALTLSATGGSRPYSWTVTGLPPGLTATAAGQISGTPAPGAAPSYAVTATVADANHQVGSTNFTWSVTAKVPELIGLHQGEAQGLIVAAGLTLGGVSVNDDCISPGEVTNQNPTGGGTALIGSPVRVTVSSCTSRGGGGGGGKILPK
jgi:Putative Ig domain/PASTA domain